MGLPRATLAVSPKERAPTETESPIIGMNTRLRAVEVPTAVAQLENGAMGTKSLLEVVAENLKSSFFSAPARTGKGVTIAACIRMVQKRVKAGTLSNVIFWTMTPKQDPLGELLLGNLRHMGLMIRRLTKNHTRWKEKMA